MALSPLEFAAKILGKIIPPRFWDNHERFFDDSGNFIPDDRVEDPGEIAALESELRGKSTPPERTSFLDYLDGDAITDHYLSRYDEDEAKWADKYRHSQNPTFKDTFSTDDLDFLTDFYFGHNFGHYADQYNSLHKLSMDVLSNRLARLNPGSKKLNISDHVGGADYEYGNDGTPWFPPSRLFFDILKDSTNAWERDLPSPGRTYTGEGHINPAARDALYKKWVPGYSTDRFSTPPSE